MDHRMSREEDENAGTDMFCLRHKGLDFPELNSLEELLLMFLCLKAI